MAYSNPFEALGLDKEDAALEALRTDFAAILREWIQQRHLTQGAAGRMLGIPQSVVSEIVNGRTGRKSLDYFVRLLTRADVAWTARCWLAPSDAAAVKGAAPATWIGTGGSLNAKSILSEFSPSSEGFWKTVQGGFAVGTHASGTPAVPPISIGGTEDG